jgi:two-component system sensor histidine kinase RegB
MPELGLNQSPFVLNLRRLFWLRTIAIAGQIAAVLGVHYGLEVSLPLAPMFAVVVLLMLLNTLTWLRIEHAESNGPVSDSELALQLLVDIAALTALMYLSGGWTNPFVSLYLLPLAIAAATLPARNTWLLTAATIACYSALVALYVPLPAGASGFELHVLGMWMTFVVSALVIAWFVARMAATLRDRDRTLARAREDVLRKEQIIAIGTLAAGAAHQLSTPLSTMAIIAGELERDATDLPRDLRSLKSQIERCRQILNQLLTTAGTPRAEAGSSRGLDETLREILDTWQLMRPQVQLKFSCAGDAAAPQVVLDATLTQAALNLLNNAADASPTSVEVIARWNARQLTLDILDRGPGLTPELLARAGEPFVTTKPGSGFGIGLLLANATVERFGGKVRLTNRDDGGAHTQLVLPLAQFAA